MSPEQVRGEKATVQSDIYSLGITLYELIAGQLPFKWATSYELLMAHLHQVPRALCEVRRDIPVALSDAIAKAVEKDPAKRFASAAEFRAALGAYKPQDMAMLTTLAPGMSTPRPSDAAHPSRAVVGEAPPSLVRHLATFIGPIAKVVATRLARQTSDVDQMYALASKEIESEPERQRFLKTRPR
jgi:serine/threonine-protein kinase